jgi:hypothetical protein
MRGGNQITMDFARDIKVLESFASDLRKIDEWMDLYSILLKDAWNSRDIWKIAQCQKVLLNEMGFVFDEWLKQESIIEKLEERGEVQ